MANKKGSSAPTITDVARLAGVSVATVSFVINEVTGETISKETQERVRAAAERLGYRPNAAAKQLRTRRSDTIGFLTDSVASAPYAGDVIRGAQDAAWRHGKVLIIVNTGGNPAIADSATALMQERRVEGLIYATEFHHPVEPPAAFRQTRAVLANCYAADRSLPSVVPDEVGGGRAATEALVRKGHRRIGIINLRPTIPAGVGRLEGYRQALAAHGLPVDESLIRHSYEAEDEGYRHAAALLEQADPPTAIFCGNDRMAMEVYEALRDRGRRVPADVAVVGFDNQVVIAARLRPPLSTVALPHYEMGRWAVDYLIAAAGPAEDPPVQHTMPCPYVERASI